MTGPRASRVYKSAWDLARKGAAEPVPCGDVAGEYICERKAGHPGLHSFTPGVRIDLGPDAGTRYRNEYFWGELSTEDADALRGIPPL